ncbi:ankyrin repeat-containing domain protein [Dunaliella salina]|uniref:Ankyrin repeat-containing domain protein n=1 Tax=Dunaliella salina TaxID=3046 RepID=A0ABQ7FWV8_DUNSA|nr:ankyrin repeat-containing domain protein [Dunaliella salina]|eukprot:KAF5826828.1 ankyrin repeat-containing domain protein [Dunaliella salina]
MACSPESVALLLKAGADPNSIIKGNATALHVAAVSSNQPAAAKIISMLLEAGADPNVKDGEGHTPLVNAALSEHQELTKLLLPKTE